MNAPHVPTDDERRLTLISVMIVFLLAAMSQTVIATAMPRIVGDLSGLHLYSWATTAYLLASTVMVPIWGKLGDLYGRKAVLLSGIGLFLAGSWLAGFSGEFGDLPLLGGGMTQLITFRAIQGTGGGALFTTAFAILADLFAPRERAQFSGLFGSIFGISSIFGPVVGGFLTDHGTMTLLGHHVAGWRWVFFFNVPFATAAVAMIVWKMPPMAPKGVGGIDWFGSGLIIATFVPLLLAITWGGREHEWGSPLILSMLAWSLACLAAFVFIEGKVREPILPLEMFRNRTFVTANGAGFVYSMAFMGVSSFLPLYMQVGLGYPATKSGLTMLSLMGGFVFSSTITGQLVTRTGHFKPFMLGGGAILVAGITLLCFIGPDTSTADLAWRLLIFGIGLGPGQSLFSLAVQNDTPPHRMGVATSSSQFVRQIGSTMGVALFGALLTASLATELAGHARANPGAQVRQLDMGDLQKMAVDRSLHPEAAAARLRDPAAQAEDRMIRESFSVAIVHGLIFSLVMLLIGFVLMVMVPAAPLRERHPPPEPEPAVGPAEPPPTAQPKPAE